MPYNSTKSAVFQSFRERSLGSFSKPRGRRRRERHHPKGLMSKTMNAHVRFESWYISLPSSAKQQRETTKFYSFWRTRATVANFSYLLLELNAVGRCMFSLNKTIRFTELQHLKVEYMILFFTRCHLRRGRRHREFKKLLRRCRGQRRLKDEFTLYLQISRYP